MTCFSATMNLFLYLTAVISVCYGASIPKCKIGSPDFNACLTKLIQSIFRASKLGFPEYGVTKSFDPLIIPKLTIDTGKGPVQLTQYYKDLTVTGFSNLTVKSVSLDLKKPILQFFAHFPKILQMGHYKIDGKILALPINGDGQSTLELSNTDVNIKLSFEKIKKDEQTYLKIISCVLDIRPQNLKVHFENLFNGNKLMGDNMNKVINEEWQSLFNDVKPSIDKTYGEVFKVYWQTFYDNIPMEKMFFE
ncbi:protein takeout-like [Euwallacea similis]|uniref:protein takeout-like n=1 Tax=Euwallacea similis TaxID=1736056 RepID=UPI00344EC5DE